MLTGNHLWHALEEVLWTVLVVLMAVAGLGMWLHVEGMMRGLIVVGWIGCAGSAYVMSGLDVPMYVRRWRHERAAGTVFRTFGSGVADAIARREVRRSWEVWRHEVAWMTPYFTVSVWLSLFLARFSAS